VEQSLVPRIRGGERKWEFGFDLTEALLYRIARIIMTSPAMLTNQNAVRR
jgi:hypothetical protein